MSLSFSKDDRGGAPLDNENSFNIAKQAQIYKQETVSLALYWAILMPIKQLALILLYWRESPDTRHSVSLWEYSYVIFSKQAFRFLRWNVNNTPI